MIDQWDGRGIMDKIEGQIQPESEHRTKISGGLSILIIHAVRCLKRLA